ncbi:unnamed protein product [Moneuplotes crassus]|uniref:Uncharacterized protein n=2 Tax=Euplotes crassus TaxID=5936 RepID=A0AAD1UBR9_EUPCR|nr:unnamed protein product [Moneuplotes crassus]
MEPLLPQNPLLLSKLSIVLNILPYYSTFNKWKSLLTHLCTHTRKLWSSNTSAFRMYALNCFSKILTYCREEFDQEFYDYLKGQEQRCRVRIDLRSADSYELFQDLLIEMEDREVRVDLQCVNVYVERVQLGRIKWVMKSLKKLDIDVGVVKQANLLDFKSERELVEHFGTSIDYIGNIYVLNAFKVKECHTLIVPSLIHFQKVDLILERIHTLEITETQLQGIKTSKIVGFIESSFPKNVRTTAKELKIMLQKGFKSFDMYLAKLHQAFPSLSILSFHNKSPSEYILSNRMKEYTGLWYNLSFGDKKETQSYFVLNDCQVLVKSEDSKDFQKVECERLEIRVVEGISSLCSFENLLIIKYYDFLEITHCQIQTLEEEEQDIITSLIERDKIQIYGTPIIINMKDISLYGGSISNLNYLNLNNTAISKLKLSLKHPIVGDDSFEIIESIPDKIEMIDENAVGPNRLQNDIKIDLEINLKNLHKKHEAVLVALLQKNIDVISMECHKLHPVVGPQLSGLFENLHSLEVLTICLEQCPKITFIYITKHGKRLDMKISVERSLEGKVTLDMQDMNVEDYLSFD